MGIFSLHDHYFGFHRRKWGLGIAAPVILAALSIWGICQGKALWVEGDAHGLGFIWIEGPAARAFAIAGIGIAVILFGWFFAYNSERLNRWYEWITGTGCLIAMAFSLRGFWLFYFSGW